MSEIIFGAAVAFVVQALKRYTKDMEAGKKDLVVLGTVLLLSLVVGWVYVSLVAYNNYWESFLAVLTSAGAVYTFIIRRFEGK